MNKKFIFTFLIIGSLLVSVKCGTFITYTQEIISQMGNKFIDEFFQNRMFNFSDLTVATVDYSYKFSNNKVEFPDKAFRHPYAFDGITFCISDAKYTFDFSYKSKFFKINFSQHFKFGFCIYHKKTITSFTDFEGFTFNDISSWSVDNEGWRNITDSTPLQLKGLHLLEQEIQIQIARVNNYIKEILKTPPQDTQLTSLPVKIDSNFQIGVTRNFQGLTMELGQSADKINKMSSSNFGVDIDYHFFSKFEGYVQSTDEEYFNSIAKALFQADKLNKEEEFNQMKEMNQLINLEKFFPGVSQKIDQSDTIKIQYKVNEQPVFIIQNGKILSDWNVSCTLIGYKGEVATPIQKINLSMKIRFIPQLVDSNRAFTLVPVETTFINISSDDKNMEDLKTFANGLPAMVLLGVSHFQLDEVYRFDNRLFILENPEIYVYECYIHIEGSLKFNEKFQFVKKQQI